MPIDVHEIKVRAAIRMGGADGFYLETPYVKSFTVNRKRGELSASFSASLKIKNSQISASDRVKMIGNLFEIWAGTITVSEAVLQAQYLPETFTTPGSRYLMNLDGSSGMRKVFTGYVLKMGFNPCREDAEFMFLNVSGNDIFYSLQNKKFTRRAKASNLEIWGAVTSVVRTNSNFDDKFPERLDLKEDKLLVNDKGVFDPNITKTPFLSVPVVENPTSAGPLQGTVIVTDSTEEG